MLQLYKGDYSFPYILGPLGPPLYLQYLLTPSLHPRNNPGSPSDPSYASPVLPRTPYGTFLSPCAISIFNLDT